ncbi:hypothetical protein GLOTRDRAFT_94677 [Gloeophyllum trabeum ATCC 11539]|uniref:F-box domain-containing protein n=1 Tax=Gloeophyllum trabeum (strain ATCC 11539 / FP-39264 / Madison 617) TaxID=670483 RepID=S7RL70_GLOTA|nr:uncharacterized protein GLOTRDRAFT_94677 [Gloeophyllum trabeum ATCC 11539]EPQ53414.1 hypothetical protein GLOTRDRAFT_94677 [Gloeophyllum trabeum ATCC 11539]
MAIIHHRRSSLNKTSEARVRQELESLSSLAELFLARSGTLPMNVSFDLDYKPFEGIQGCFQTWRSCIARCKSLRLHVVVPMLRLFFPVPVELPLLESLQYIPVFCSPVIPVSLANISAPRLASLSLDSIRETDSIDIGIPASQLTELRLETALNLSVIRLLEAQCQSLKTVRLHFDRSVVSRMRPMTFPNLEDADLKFPDDIFDVVLPNFVAPSLQALRIAASSSPLLEPFVMFLARMLAASGSQLRKLHIDCWEVFEDVEGLYRVLKAVPSLSFLSIFGSLSSGIRLDEILDPLIHRDPATNQFPVPHLAKLNISFNADDAEGCADDESLCEILDLRRSGEYAVAKLETVDIENYRPKPVWRIRPGVEGIIRDPDFTE